VIKKPLDMTKIWHRVSKLDTAATGYTSLDEMCQDFGLMFENACIYNEPASTLYKDALTLQRALFQRRERIMDQEAAAAGLANVAELDSVAVGAVQAHIGELIDSLFECTIQYQDLEGRVLSECFIELYDLMDSERQADSATAATKPALLTFELIRKRVKEKYYKRLDVFQEELFELFNQVRSVLSSMQFINLMDYCSWAPMYNCFSL
jgi:protein polybromo-1